MDEHLKNFLEQVYEQRSTLTSFNPWRDFDALNDLERRSPEWRLGHLERYLQERIGVARAILIGEAGGWRGLKFSGVAMTSERQLIREQMDLFDQRGVYFEGEKFRTSRAQLGNGDKNAYGMLENTATIAWRTMLKHLGSREFAIWNTYAWQPHNAGDTLSNRKPFKDEVDAGTGVLRTFLELFEGAKVIAVGDVAARALEGIQVDHVPVRHPSFGGATKFANELEDFFRTGSEG